MANLFLEQNTLSGRIVDAFEKFSKNPDTTLAACKVRMRNLEKNFQKFEDNHNAIISSREYPEISKHVYFTENVFYKIEENFYKT